MKLFFYKSKDKYNWSHEDLFQRENKGLNMEKMIDRFTK